MKQETVQVPYNFYTLLLSYTRNPANQDWAMKNWAQEEKKRKERDEKILAAIASSCQVFDKPTVLPKPKQVQPSFKMAFTLMGNGLRLFWKAVRARLHV